MVTRCLLFLIWASCVHANQLEPLEHMARYAAWGAANDAKYGKDMSEWDATSARHVKYLDTVNSALEEAPVVKHMDLMAENAAWGAANERAYGKSRSGSDVDWNKHREHAQKVKELAGTSLGDALETAAMHAAWYAANKFSYGEGNKDTKHSLRVFEDSIASAKKQAPANWPMQDIAGMFKTIAVKCASHRSADLLHQKRKRKDEHHYETPDKREDWHKFHENADKLIKALGADQRDLFDHFEGMCIESAWGATHERKQGKHSNDAQVHWEKYRFHADEAKRLYKGGANFDDIKFMVTSAAWGAANVRAYGDNDPDAKQNWRDFESAKAKVFGAHGGGEL